MNEAMTTYAEQVKAMIMKRRPTTNRFSLQMEKEQAIALLKGAVMAEVAFRHREFEETEEFMKQIRLMAEWLTKPNGKFCIVLCGLCGNGKTTLIKAFQQVLNILDIKDCNNEHYGLVIKDAKEIAWMCKESHQQWDKLCQKKMLAIDDLGTEPLEVLEYGNHMNPVIDLLYKRYDEQLFTIITTNMQPQELRERYGIRIADRLNEISFKLVFENASYRKTL